MFKVFVETIIRQFIVNNGKLNFIFLRNTRLNDMGGKENRFYKMELSENVTWIFKGLILVSAKMTVMMKIIYRATEKTEWY